MTSAGIHGSYLSYYTTLTTTGLVISLELKMQIPEVHERLCSKRYIKHGQGVGILREALHSKCRYQFMKIKRKTAMNNA